ncbi:MAG: type II secretion system F family protein [Patescibacteria group bacterium]|nr:type II secretion system F family protein [Patescibacteria group bacterium]
MAKKAKAKTKKKSPAKKSLLNVFKRSKKGTDDANTTTESKKMVEQESTFGSCDISDRKKLSALTNLEIGKEKDFFIENLSILFSSGMDLISVLDSIKGGVKSRPMLKMIEDVKQDVNAGTPIWCALRRTGLFPDHIISLIRIGEETGKLPDNLGVIVIQQAKERIFKSRIQTAMMYPILVLLVTLVIGTGITWLVLPRLITVFTQMRMELPLITRIMIAVGNFMQAHGAIVAPSILITSGTVLYLVFINPKTKHIGQGILLKTPVINRLIQEVEISRFGYIFGTLLDAGLPIVNALNSLTDASTYFQYKKLYTYMKESIAEGQSLKDCFDSYPKSTKLIPRSIQHMLMASEQSGRLPESLLNIGKMYEDKLENTTKNLTVLLEPFLLVIVWGAVLSVALSVIMPLYSMIGKINTVPDKPSSQPPPEEEPIDESTADGTETLDDTTANEENPEAESEAPAPVEPILPTLQIMNTETGALNIRDYPSTTGEIIGTAAPDEIYSYRNQTGDWYEIQIDDETFGWVFGQYVLLLD